MNNGIIKHIDKYNNDMIHCFNDIPPHHKCILGTFTDYLIRKMIHDIRGDPVNERLICEIPLQHQQNYSPWRKIKNLNKNNEKSKDHEQIRKIMNKLKQC